MHESTDERWMPVVGYEGRYEVSDHGRVRSVERMLALKSGRDRMQPARILSFFIGSGPQGRRVVELWKENRRCRYNIGPLVLKAFAGPAPEGMEACHDDGDRLNDRLSNLRWDTRSANQQDSVRHGTHPSARKTHCPRGHLLAEPNLVPWNTALGQRQCLACSRARSACHAAKRRGSPRSDFVALAERYHAQIVGSSPQENWRNSGPAA